MTSFFKRLMNPGGRASGESGPGRLALAAFGKHPGWNDHIPGIGVETEALAHVKHAMYVSGIGGRIDAGAWKVLDAEKRLEGFRHTFLWFRGGHAILGRMHSSEDGLRRKEYPLVFCVDAEGISPERMLTAVLPELERLLNACQATASAAQVTAECGTVQDRLRDILLRQATPAIPPLNLSPELRRRFIEHLDLGPERVGMLRILHELGSAGSRESESDADARHLRLPLAADSPQHALLLWAGFLQGAVTAATPLLFISRDGADWIDAVVGEPNSDDFFCLQASLKALPLASQIPYDLTPELKPRLQQLEAKFLGAEAAAPARTQPAAAPAGVPPPVSPARPDPSASTSLAGPIAMITIAVVLMAVAGVWLFSGKKSLPPESKPPPGTSSVPSGVDVVVTSGVADPTSSNENAVVRPEQKPASELKTNPAVETKKATQDKGRDDVRLNAPVVEAAKSTAANARAGDEDAGLAHIALAQGNYARALEIAGKWPGSDSFREILAQIAVETNQLFQLDRALLAGNYAPILTPTNLLPDNPKFQEVIAKAGVEAKLLEQARTEFAKGDYAFLQRQELLDLKAKPPFQKLVKEGGVEADFLKKAQTLMTEGQPQAVHDLIVQNKLTKPPFAEIAKWANTELERTAGQKQDLQQTEALFKQGEYTRAMELCRKYSGVAAFDAMAKGISQEQRILAAAEKKFSEGDYSFLSELAAQGYRTKPPFAELLRKGGIEQTALGDLEKLKQANDWQAVQSSLGKLAAGVSAKKPFVELNRWAESKSADAEAQKAKGPGWLDAELELLLVRFGVVGPSDRWLQTPAARKEASLDGFLSLDAKDYYLNRVRWLRAEYTKRGWIDQRERKNYLDRLESNIKNR